MRHGTSRPPPTGTSSFSGGGPASPGGAGKAGSLDAQFDAALALGQTVDSGDSSQHPAPVLKQAAPSPVQGLGEQLRA